MQMRRQRKCQRKRNILYQNLKALQRKQMERMK